MGHGAGGGEGELCGEHRAGETNNSQSTNRQQLFYWPHRHPLLPLLGSIGPPSPSPPLLPQVRRGSPCHGGEPAGGEEIADPLPLPLVRSQLIPRSQPPRVSATSCRTSAVPRRSRTAMTTPMTIPREPKTRRETARLISLMGGRFWSTLGDSNLDVLVRDGEGVVDVRHGRWPRASREDEKRDGSS